MMPTCKDLVATFSSTCRWFSVILDAFHDSSGELLDDSPRGNFASAWKHAGYPGQDVEWPEQSIACHVILGALAINLEYV